MKKLLVVTIFLFVMVSACLVSLYFICGKGGDSTSFDEDFLVFPQNIKDEDNAYFYMIDAIKYYTKISEFVDDSVSMENTEFWEEENLKKTLSAFEKYQVWEKNKSAVTKMFNALEYKEFSYPYELKYSSPLPSVLELKEFSKIICCKAIILFREGKETEALELISNGVCFGNLVQKSPFIICFFVGKMITTRHLETMYFLLPKVTSVDILQKNIKVLSSIISNQNSLWTKSQRGEYTMFCDAFHNLDVSFGSGNNIKEKFLRFYFFQPNNTKRMMKNYVEKSIEMSAQNWDYVEKNLEDIFPSQTWINMYGYNILNMCFPMQKELISSLKASLIRLKMMQILLAIKSYHINYGKLPDNLEALVAKYLTTIPIDDFDGTQMKYSLKDKKVFSEWEWSNTKKESFIYDIKF